jgi:hypothetical protein
VNQSSWLSDTQRVERYQSLRQATARHEPPVITEAGLRLIRELAVSPQRPEASDEQLRPELERLVQAGVVGDDGSLRIDAEEFLGTMRWSDVQVQIEVGAGRSVRTWSEVAGVADDEVGVEPERLAQLASELENLRDVLAHNVPQYQQQMQLQQQLTEDKSSGSGG